MKKIFYCSVVILSLFSISSCKKNDTGRESTVVVFPEHHKKPIYGATVYVKFGTKELPSDPTTNYDLKVVGEAGEDHIHIKELRYGNYFIYAVGYDSSIAQTVNGGIALKIKWKERKEEINIEVPVTE